MRLITWVVRVTAFILLLAFAVKNTDPITLRFYFDLAWQAPLVVLLLAFFTAGALMGLAAMLTAMLRQRREIQRLREELRTPGTPGVPVDAVPRLPPAPDG